MLYICLSAAFLIDYIIFLCETDPLLRAHHSLALVVKVDLVGHQHHIVSICWLSVVHPLLYVTFGGLECLSVTHIIHD